jgi:N-acetylglucosaminyl-diphospho-decaprenol L-rhamnosyltransferase
LLEKGQETTAARRVAAVIVHYGDSRRTVRAVLSHYKLGIFSDVIVVANDLSHRPADLKHVSCKWVIPGRNLGYGGACQTGAMTCQADVYAFLNAHVTIDRASVNQCVSAFDVKDVGIAAPCIYHPGKGDPEVGWRYVGSVRKYSRILRLPINVPSAGYRANVRSGRLKLIDNGWASGGSLFCRAEVVRQVGWDGSYFLGYEDVDISMRARKYGWRVVNVSPAIAFHSGESTRASSASAYYEMRNALWFCRKHHARRIQALLTAYLLARLFRVAVADVLKRRHPPRFRPAARGILDGWSLWPGSVDALLGEPLWVQ